MSLTQILEESETKKFLKNLLKKPKMHLFENSVEPTTKRYSRIGIAFDYALRFGLFHRFPSNVYQRPLVAGAAVYIVIKENFPSKFKNCQVDFEKAKDILEKIEISDTGEGRKAAKAAFILADLDPIFRRKMMFPETPISETEISELIELYNLIDFEIFAAHDRIFLNPHFNVGSKRVRGADADLIIGDTLIDFKTTKHPKITLEMVRQLVGYSLLCNKFGIGGYDSEKFMQTINKVGIYFARAGELFIVELSDIIDETNEKTILNWILNHEYSNLDIDI
jgi:hypothetical protein